MSDKLDKQLIDPPFEIQGSDQEKNRIVNMINQIAGSETGKQTLEIASNAGYKLGMEFIFGCNGACSKEKKIIVLNPVSKDDVLIGVLAHETRHAGQFERGEYDASDDKRPRNETLKSNIMRTRAVEADAQATAAQILGEMMENGNEKPLIEFCRQPDNQYIGRAFSNALYEDGALYNGAARTAAFLAWYENKPIMKAYDQAYQVDMMEHREASGANKTDTYSKVETPEKIVKDLCLDNKGGCYFKENPEVLGQGKYVEVDYEIQGKLDELMSRVPKKQNNLNSIKNMRNVGR